MNQREKTELQKKTAMELLWKKPIQSTLVERWFLLEEACRRYEDEPQPLAMGKGLSHILAHASLPIEECDLLLGRYDDHVPTAEEEEKLQAIWQERAHRHKTVITHFNKGHLTLDWETLVKIGISGYLEKTEKRLLEATDEKTRIFLSGMRLTYEAIRHYIARYGEEAEKKGYAEQAQVCKNLTVAPPRTFREALQLVLFVFTVYLIYAGWRVACLTLGRMDVYLLPFYEADLAAGRYSREDIRDFIEDFQCKTSFHLGRGEHQMTYADSAEKITGWDRNQVFDSPTYIVIGGRGTEKNPLTRLFAEAITPGMKNPVYIYRWHRDRAKDVWQIICEKLRRNASILTYNDETMIPAMRSIGVEEQDAENYSVHPCNWPDITGGSAALGQIGDPIPEMLLHTLYDEKGDPNAFSSTEEIYGAFEKNYRAFLQEQTLQLRRQYALAKNAKIGTLSMNDCFLPGPMERGRSAAEGGVKYPAVYLLIRNIATAADMMSAIEQLVFVQKKVSLAKLLNAAKENFAHSQELLSACRRTPKFGTDREEADRHAVRLMRLMLDEIDKAFAGREGEEKLYPLCVTITDMDHIPNGKRLPATPDGRLAGEPLSENLSPTVGFLDSTTALLNSVVKLPFERIHSGALNLRFHSAVVKGEKGRQTLEALLDTYFGKGGMQVQISVADTETLKAAQKDPDAYRDLRVRITGYSAVFVDMSQNGQEEIIRREELNG